MNVYAIVGLNVKTANTVSFNVLADDDAGAFNKLKDALHLEYNGTAYIGEKDGETVIVSENLGVSLIAENIIE